MPNQTRSRSKKSGSTKKSRAKSTKKTGSAAPAKSLTPKDRERFVRDLLIRGEAAKPSPDGSLPPGATHKIVKEKEGELPEIERERFSIY